MIGEEPPWLGNGLIEDGTTAEDGKPLVGQSPSRELQGGGRMQATPSGSTTRSSTPYSA